MSKQTTTFSHAFHYVWLKNAEKKLIGAFEDIHNVCFAIIEECLRSSTLEHSNLCCSCKENDHPNGFDFAKERKRYKMRFSSSVESWKDKFLKLRKKYQYLKRNSCKKKGNLSAESKADIFEEARGSEKVNRIDTELEVSTEKKEEPKCFMPDDSDKPIENTPRLELPDVIILNSDDDSEPRTQSNTPESLHLNNENLQDDILPKMNGRHENFDYNVLETEEEFDSSSSEKRSGHEDESDPSWKRANHASLQKKWNNKIRYLDSGKTLSTNKSIHQFFAPHSVTQARNISVKRSKRQRMDSSSEFSAVKRTKEGSMNWASDSEGSLKVIDNMIKTANSVLDSNPDKREGEFDADSKDYRTQRYKNDLENRARQGHSDDTEKLTSITDKPIAGPTVSKASAPPSQDLRKGRYSKEEEPGKKAHDIIGWSFCDTECLPTSASTPVVPTETGKKYHQNAKDFEDTMWSAPDSPAVVRSILSTPNKTPDSDKIPDICHLGKQKENQKENGHSKLLGRESKLQILKDKQPLVTNASKDSILMGHHNNVTEKTSDGDLSADMFYEQTENTEIIQEENIVSKEIPPKREQKEAITIRETDAKAKFKDSTCFQRPKSSVNYKFNAVVRKRDERDKLDGYACAQCTAWYDDEKDCEEKRNHLRNVCRHKAVSSPPPSTPDGFWSLGFPDTPVYMKKGLMLAEDDSLPLHARPKKRKDRADKNKEAENYVDA